MRFHQRKGFTLIELLVVIAIIAILAAILFPVFAKARAKARETACLAHCKQIGTGLQMYCDDFDGFMPPIYIATSAPKPNGKSYWNDDEWAWNQCMYAYVKNDKVFFCPDKPSVRGIPDDIYDVYGINVILAPASGTSTSVNSLEAPANTFFVVECSNYYINPQDVYGPLNGWNVYIPGEGQVGDGWGVADASFSNPAMKQDAMSGRHNGRMNTVFADGHAAGVHASKVVRQCQLKIQGNPNAFDGTASSL